MSNDYIVDLPPLISGETAKSSDVNARYENTVTAFDRLPTPKNGEKGFSAPVPVGAPVNPDHAVTKSWAETGMTSQLNAATQAATDAGNSETAAQGYAGNALSSQQAAATSANSASTSASNALASEQAAATSADNALASEQAAATSASAAAGSETAAEAARGVAITNRNEAVAARDQAVAAYEAFDERYLGPKTANPALDNEGGALVAGSMYFNTVEGVMRVFDGSNWNASFATINGQTLQEVTQEGAGTTLSISVGGLSSTGPVTGSNLAIANWNTAYGWGNHASQGYLKSVTFSQVNGKPNTLVGYGITDAATAAQGIKADEAYSWGDHSLAGYATAAGTVTLDTAQTFAASKTFADNQIAYFGSGNDFGIRFNGSAAYLRTYAHGALSYLQAENSGGTLQNHIMWGNGDVSLYHDSAVRLSTTAGGVTVTGALTVSGGNSGQWNTAYSATQAATSTATGGRLVQRDSEGDAAFRYAETSYTAMSHSATTRSADTVFYSSTDNFIRKNTAAGMRDSLSVPTTTGSGASGTWGISISGKAADANLLDGLDSGAFLRSNTNDVCTGRIEFTQGIGGHREDDVYVTPTSKLYSAYWKFTQAAQLNSPPGTGSWRHTLTLQLWSQHNASYPSYQMSFGNGAIGVRQSTSNTAWGSWRTLIDSSNYTTYAPTKTGGGASGTWGISISGNATTASTATNLAGGSVDAGGLITTATNNDAFNTGSENTLSVRGSTTHGAVMSFHRPAAYGVKFGLDTDNVFKLGGWSATSVRHSWDMSGNYTATGNVTAFSDPRLKENIAPLNNALALLQTLDGVSFRWKDMGDEKLALPVAGKNDYGVLADQVEAIAPYAVLDSTVETPDGDKYKTVAYDKLVPFLIEAVKTLSNKADQLESQLANIVKELENGTS